MLPFATYAKEFLATHSMEDMVITPDSFNSALECGYVVIQVGLFDVWYPRYLLRDKEYSDEFEDALVALFDMQEAWIRWCGISDAIKDGKKDCALLRKWVHSVSSSRIVKYDGKPGVRPGLIEMTGSEGAIKTASDDLTSLMVSGLPLGRSDKDTGKVSLVLSPTREDFIKLLSFVGSLSENNKNHYWNDRVALWNSFIWEGKEVLALQIPIHRPGDGDVFEGFDLNEREATGLQQHVVQHAAKRMIEFYFRKSIPLDLTKGMAINLVIELFGENNVRVGGGKKGRQTAAQSKFVAGGNSSGGRLAAVNADCRWRQNKGKDYFLKELQKTQKNGFKEARKNDRKLKDKEANFALEPDSGSKEPYVLSAPFLTLKRREQDLPESVRDDYLEFMRAYRSAFAYWFVHVAGVGKGRKSDDNPWQQLLLRLEKPEGKGEAIDFSKLVEEVYGKPFTSESWETPSLEKDFLSWLPRGKA